ncbi:MAG: hypothetical protein M1821_006094 [Bathelium mastoideum]|nr:MAG: hypothetical protein M1821_006094 [Bathelium mastoideum]
MFWRFGGYSSVSTVDTLLEKSDLSLEELLDESDLIQELKQQNSKLVEYLRDKNVLNRLLRYVIASKSLERVEEENTTKDEDDREHRRTSSPLGGFFGGGKNRSRARSTSASKPDSGETEEDKAEKQRLKYAYVSCEILSSEVWSISEALLENRAHLREFWTFLEQEPPLDPLQAGYFTKVNESLLDKKTEEMLDFVRSLDNVVPNMLKHIDCPMVMDLLLKIISLEKSDGGQGVVDWLQIQNLMPQLLGYLSPEHSTPTQSSAGDFLKAIITISANATTQDQSVIGPNELTRELVSQRCIETLAEDMLRGGNPLTVGVGSIIEVIRKNNSDYDLENQVGLVPRSSDPIYLGTLLRQFAKRVPDFMELISNPDHVVVLADGTKQTRKREMKVAFGEKIEPLGFDRFKTCELMAELLHCSNMGLLNERGAEADVHKRNEEREQLKAEGKYTPAKEQSIADFGTSIDSQGFHHASAPSDALSDSPEEIKKLEIQNSAEEEDFEKVAVPEAEALSEDNNHDDFDEKTVDDAIGVPLTKTSNPASPQYDAEKEGQHELEDEKHDSSEFKGYGDDHSSKNEATESAESVELSQKLDNLTLDSDHVQPSDNTNDSPDDELPSMGKLKVSLLTQQLRGQEQQLSQSLDPNNYLSREVSPHAEDKPAPLFAAKSSDQNADESQHLEDHRNGEIRDIPNDTADVDGKQNEEEHDLSHSLPFEPDLGGSPVVGDYLKMQFVDHKVVPTILDFFFRFPWNNFLHNVVYDVVQQVFNGSMDRGYNRTLAIDLFTTGRITERIIEGQRRSDEVQQETKMRLGYMGHLTLIAEEVVKFCERNSPDMLSPEVLEKVMSQDWVKYVEHTLAETRERDNAILGGVRPDFAGGPRQAVLNAVNVAGGFGGGVSSALANAGLGSNGSTALDSMDLAGAATNSTTGYNFNSGFGSSSDEEDEESEEQDEGRNPRVALEDQEQQDPPTTATTTTVPPPLNIPTRARRQLAARLAQRQQRSAPPSSADGDAATTTLLDPPATNPTTGQPSARGGLDTVDLGPGTESAQQSLHSAFEPFEGEEEGDEDDEEEDDLLVGELDIGPATAREIEEAEREIVARTRAYYRGDGEGMEDEDEDEGASSDEEVEDAVRAMLERRSKGAGIGEGAERQGSSDGEDEQGIVGLRQEGRRPSTTEAKVRRPLDDDDDEEDEDSEPEDEPWMQRSGRAIPGERKEQSPFADEQAEDSDEDGEGLIEIGSRRRTS